jgi:hypothetical protein
MKFANVKGMVAKSMILAVAAGALVLASPVKAEAQRFVIGVRVGDPYYAPRYDHYDRYEYARQEEFRRQEEFQRRQAFYRHEQWQRMHRDDRSYGYR